MIRYRHRKIWNFAAGAAGLLLAGSTSAETAAKGPVAWGRELAFSQDKGNCLACHHIAGGTQMGDIGPPLQDMRARFPDRATLRQQIWDPGLRNLYTMMPPYGRHQILTEAELDAVVEFLYTR